MHLMIIEKDGKRVYTLKKVLDGKVTRSAHPGRSIKPEENPNATFAAEISFQWNYRPFHVAKINFLFVSLIYGCSISMIG